MRPIDALRAHGGVARWATLNQEGVRREDLKRAVAAGEVLRPCRGVYASPWAEKLAVAVVCAGGYLSHASAAAAWGLDVLKIPNKLHIALPVDAKAPPDSHVHRIRRSDLVHMTHAPWPMTTVSRTLVDCARTMPLPEALVVIDSALRRKAITPDELNDLAATVRGPSAVAARRALQSGDHRSDSVGETVLRAAALDAGLPAPELQYEIRLADGGLAVADMAWPTYCGRPVKVAVEYDGFDAHGHRTAFVRDRDRWNRIDESGWRLRIFTRRDVTLRYRQTGAAIRRTIESRWAEVGG